MVIMRKNTVSLKLNKKVEREKIQDYNVTKEPSVVKFSNTDSIKISLQLSLLLHKARKCYNLVDEFCIQTDNNNGMLHLKTGDNNNNNNYYYYYYY